MKIRKSILYLLIAVYSLVLIHINLPHDHYCYSDDDFLEDQDVCLLMQHDHHEEEDCDHTYHHHPHSHQDECNHIGKHIKTTNPLDLLKIQPLFCELLPDVVVPKTETSDVGFFPAEEPLDFSKPFLETRNLRAPPFSI